MRIHTLRREQELDGTPDEVFPFFADAFNLEALTPPLLRFRVVTPGPIDMHAGTLIQYRLRLRGVPVTWKTLIQEWTPEPALRRHAALGPLRAVAPHPHVRPAPGRAHADDATRSATRSASAPLGELAHRALVRRDVEAIFDYRREALVPLLARGSRGLRRGQTVEHEVDAGQDARVLGEPGPGDDAVLEDDQRAVREAGRARSRRRARGRPRPWARSPRASGCVTPSCSRNAVCEAELSVETP